MKYILAALILGGALAVFLAAPRKSCPLPERTASKTAIPAAMK